MAIPTCPHCGAKRFQVTEDEPSGADYKVWLVHCADCGAPFGAMEYLVAGVLLKKQAEAIARVQNALVSMASQLDAIQRALRA